MQAAELLREQFLADLQPDIVHLSTLFEGFGADIVGSIGRLDPKLSTAVTLYDLIPMLNADTYLAESAMKRFYLRRLQALKRADLLLAISESSRREAIEALDISPDRITTIGAGLSESFQKVTATSKEQADLIARYGLNDPFVLYTAGYDSRKNIEGLIAAFSLLPNELRAAHRLVIVGKLHGHERSHLAEVAAKNGLNVEEMVCPGYIPDEDLRLLYATCAVFVFPSFHEGFGLPVLEAMACGAPVIGSNCSSVPEIIGRDDALFDPKQPGDIASRIAQVLSNAELRQDLKVWGIEKAKAFTWEASARKALSAFEALYAERKTKQTVRLPSPERRPLLAFVAPLPPERTAVAVYCASLLPNIARYYEIVCVVDQLEVTEPWITANFAICDVRWFEAHAARFDRILYHIGNSEFHKHCFDLLRNHPGVVVLHDFYLGDILNWMQANGSGSTGFVQVLYESHGFSALLKDRSEGRHASIVEFPCNSVVLRGSMGVIVHSNHAVDLATKWYGASVPIPMRRIPHLRSPLKAADPMAARQRLKLPDKAFVVCSFGAVAPPKLSHRLLQAWLSSPLAHDEYCVLVFVGKISEGEYEKQILDSIARSADPSRIRITGYAEESLYRDYLSAGDVAVQLRTGSGETSDALIDALSLEVPLVVNAHGSAAELPDDAVVKLDDNFTDEALSAAIARLRTDPGLRRYLAACGVSHLKRFHHPERIAALYRDFIEEVYATSSQAREQELVRVMGHTLNEANPTTADLKAVAISLAANRPRFGARQILVDVTLLAKFDVRSGIQRVTRAILIALIADPPPGYRVEPVRAVQGGYVYARRFACQCLSFPNDFLVDDPVEARLGDIFLGLDLSPYDVPYAKDWFLEQRRRGVQIIFVTYDLLPILRPELFSPTREVNQALLDWINTITVVSDAVVCISRTVADELHGWLVRTKPQRPQPLALGYFRLGADLHASLPTTGVPADAQIILEKLSSRPSFLMVGTLEPRKGHRQALDAFELLWTDGIDANLVIVGAKGWMMDDLVDRLCKHAERDSRLFWLKGISDEMLEKIYRTARALLVASEAEGFGLPLVEAAQYGLPIIARDISIFREVAGDHAYYFSGGDPKAISNALRDWQSLGDAVPASTGIRSFTWHQSSRQLLDVVLGKRWYRSWPDEASPGKSQSPSFGTVTNGENSALTCR
jgi:glycosyltransferase involved in cell wall biosynthesis